MAGVELLFPFFLLGAFLYSSVGHGGATIYLAILTLACALGPAVTSTVLVLNIVVAALAFLQFRQAGHMRPRLLWPFAITSVPAAFLGGLMRLDGRTHEVILGAALLLAAARFLLLRKPPVLAAGPPRGTTFYAAALGLGALLGFVAGMTGIGGGIFLSPILVVLAWASIKEAASVASAFILLNSLSGLAARWGPAPPDWQMLLPLTVAVLIGGYLGSLMGARRFSPPTLQLLLGLVLFVAGLRALFELNAWGCP